MMQIIAKLMTPRFLRIILGNCDNIDPIRMYNIAGHKKRCGCLYNHDIFFIFGPLENLAILHPFLFYFICGTIISEEAIPHCLHIFIESVK